jgi:hypothetical protein
MLYDVLMVVYQAATLYLWITVIVLLVVGARSVLKRWLTH